MNEKGGTDCNAFRETVRRLSFWIMQITGAIDLGENPDNVAFPNTRTCRDLVQLKKEVEALQQKCEDCHSKNTGGDSKRVSSLEKKAETLKKGLAATVTRLDQLLSYQQNEHAQFGELHRKADTMRDELTAWEVYYRQHPGLSEGPEKQPEEEANQVQTSVITTMARLGDTKIEVLDPDRFPVGKYIVIQEFLIYLVVGKGSLIYWIDL